MARRGSTISRWRGRWPSVRLWRRRPMGAIPKSSAGRTARRNARKNTRRNARRNAGRTTRRTTRRLGPTRCALSTSRVGAASSVSRKPTCSRCTRLDYLGSESSGGLWYTPNTSCRFATTDHGTASGCTAAPSSKRPWCTCWRH